MVCRVLGQKVGAFEVGVHDVFIAFWRGFEYVGAHAGGNAGVVDEQVEAAKGVECGIHEAFAVFYAGYVALTDMDVLPAFSNTCCGFFCCCLVARVVDEDVVARVGKAKRDASAYASAGSGDECCWHGSSCFLWFGMGIRYDIRS